MSCAIFCFPELFGVHQDDEPCFGLNGSDVGAHTGSDRSVAAITDFSRVKLHEDSTF